MTCSLTKLGVEIVFIRIIIVSIVSVVAIDAVVFFGVDEYSWAWKACRLSSCERRALGFDSVDGV